MWDLLKPAVGPAIDKALDLIPNANARARAREELNQSMADGLQQLQLGQIEVNKVEAAHKSLFVAGWRPAIGWTCAIALFWFYVGRPFAIGLAGAFGQELYVPSIEVDTLYQLVLALLGMGTLRTFERIKGVNREK